MNRLNPVLAHIRNTSKELSAWHGIMRGLSADLYNLINRYREIQGRLESLSTAYQGHQIDGVIADPVPIVRQDIKNSKVIRRQYGALRSIEDAIRKLYVKFLTNVRQFNDDGIIQTPRGTVDLE